MRIINQETLREGENLNQSRVHRDDYRGTDWINLPIEFKRTQQLIKCKSGIEGRDYDDSMISSGMTALCL